MKLFFITVFAFFPHVFGCPTGTIHGTNSNFCYKPSGDSASWLSANYKCRQLGGELATIDNSFLNQILYGAGQDHYGDSGSVWFGETTMFVPGKWLWADGSNATYTNWGPNQPISNTGSYCSSMRMTNGQWYSEDCQTSKPYFCEIPQGTSNITCPTSTCPTLLPLPEGFNATWEYLSATGKCYLFVSSDRSGLPGYQAQQYCQQFGADSLIIINNSVENTLVGNIMSLFECPTIWGCSGVATLGLYNNGTGWVWVDGSSLTYTNWKPNDNINAMGVANLRYGNLTDFTNLWENDLSNFWALGSSASFICQKVIVKKDIYFTDKKYTSVSQRSMKN